MPLVRRLLAAKRERLVTVNNAGIGSTTWSANFVARTKLLKERRVADAMRMMCSKKHMKYSTITITRNLPSSTLGKS